MTAEETFSLTPVETLSRAKQSDLLAVRNQRAIRESSFKTHVIAEAEHFAWIQDIASDPASCFFAFSVDKAIAGGIGLKQIDPEAKQAEWSFYLSADRHGEGLGLKMAIMGLDRFFSDYALERIVGETLPDNEVSHRFHRKLGFRTAVADVHGLPVQDRIDPVTVFELTDSWWHKAREGLL